MNTNHRMKIIRLALLVASLVVTPLFSTLTQAKQTPTASPVNLAGTFTYFTFAQKTQVVLQDNEYPTTGTLRLLENHGIELSIVEDHGAAGLRETTLVGTITPSGLIKMTYNFPASFLIEYFKWHTGCTISGNFPIYFGTFDGKRLLIMTAFNSQCPEYTPTNDIFETPVDGPLHWKWLIDLTVVE